MLHSELRSNMNESSTCSNVPSEERGSDLNVDLNSTPGLVTNRYLLTDEELGRGSFGVVQSCIDLSNFSWKACKSILRKNIQRSAMEFCIMHYLPPHPTIILPEAIFEDEKFVHVIMERCPMGDLLTLIQKTGWLPESVAAPIFRKVICGISFCHSYGIIHCDIKPENIILTLDQSGGLQPKITDFGLAEFQTSNNIYSVAGFHGPGIGSPPYVAPEVMDGSPNTTASDIWSAGVMLFAMLTGKLPDWEKSYSSQKILCIERLQNVNASPLVINLVLRMISLDPMMRPSTEQVLLHPWFVSLSVQKYGAY